MKKVLVLAAAVALFATPALAAITGTKHDLSSGNAYPVEGSSNEICVYCHTPHGATAAGIAPLWNRTTPAPTNVYANSSLNATITLAGVTNSDAPLCLSCHDGTSLSAGLNNEPNSGTVTITGTLSTAANLGTNLSNDHPVGFDWSTATADTEINASPVGVKVDFGATAQMWCSSCHDVHGGVAGTPFLVINNAGSNLCKACHIK